MSWRYILDTNTISHSMRGQENVVRRMTRLPMDQLCISAITEAEMHYGLQKRPDAKKLRRTAEELLLRLDIAPFDSAVAQTYGTLRVKMEQVGKSLSPFDNLIAAHALTLDLILVTNDDAFQYVPNLRCEDWTKS